MIKIEKRKAADVVLRIEGVLETPPPGSRDLEMLKEIRGPL